MGFSHIALKKLGKRINHLTRFSIVKHRPRPVYSADIDRIGYQQKYMDFKIEPGSAVLDIGSGEYPFPYATVLTDRFLEPSKHRTTPFQREGKPVVLSDIHDLPFHDKSFDFIYCSHALEHVDKPLLACSEIIRIGKQGYIETPTLGQDALFAWAKDMHKWLVLGCAQNLCFFEYSPRQLEGIRSSAWKDIIFSKWYHPLQEAFYANQDLFNLMFTWNESFAVLVFHLDGNIETMNVNLKNFNIFNNPIKGLP